MNNFDGYRSFLEFSSKTIVIQVLQGGNRRLFYMTVNQGGTLLTWVVIHSQRSHVTSFAMEGGKSGGC